MHFKQLENILEDDGIVFLSYGGFLTQTLISGMTDALEKEVQSNDLSMKISGNIFTIFIELSQNMMNYAKQNPDSMNGSDNTKGLIVVGSNPDGESYYIISRNRINESDKAKIELRMKDIEGLDKEELRKLYREKRKTGKDKHDKGAGIGFIEVARRCDKVEHEFQRLKNGTYYFSIKATINK